MPKQTATADTQPETAKVKPIVPVDPGDAHGIGATDLRPIDPSVLHEAIQDVRAREEDARLGRF